MSIESDWLGQIKKAPGYNGVLKITEDLKDNYPDVDYVVWWENTTWGVDIRDYISKKDINNIVKKKQEIREKYKIDYHVITPGTIKAFDLDNLPRFPAELLCASYACNAAMRSTSERLKVGAVISSSDYTNILSYGYNGDEMGGFNVPTNSLPGLDGYLHAEENALLKLNSPEDAKIFITDSPCSMCAKRIINSRTIKEVYYIRRYRDLSGIGLLIRAGISVRHIIIKNDKRILTDNEAVDLLTLDIFKTK